MHHFRTKSVVAWTLATLVIAVAAGCRGDSFDPRAFPATDALFQASVRQFEARKWDNAIKGFERLTTELPARDPRLPVVYHYLARAQSKTGDHLIAAQSFTRLSESFPDDSLADDALLAGAGEYQTMWRKPGLDAQHGQSALNLYRTLQALYPASPLAARAEAGVARLEQWFATKDYDTGFHYMKLKAYDSAIIYFKDVIRLYPNAPRARDAHLRLLETYRKIKYNDEARELCDSMRPAYASDRDVLRACPATAATG